MSILDDYDVLSERTDKAVKRNQAELLKIAMDFGIPFVNCFTVEGKENVSFVQRVKELIDGAFNPPRPIYSIDCRKLCKGDAYGWLSKVSEDEGENPIVVIEYVTQIPDGDPTIYDDPNYVSNLLLRSWKNEDIFAGDLHMDRRKFTVILTCPTEDEDILQRECGLCSYSWKGDFEKYLEDIHQMTDEEIDRLISMENTEKKEKTGIVLNRMYTGSYLSTNLGHEVINMFQADNGKHYLYLNSKGNFSAKGKEVGTMLLVRGIGDKRVEVVGVAKNLKVVKSACCTLPRDLGKVNKKEVQEKFKENIKYCGVPIKDIFGQTGQQSVFVSYWVEEGDFYIPKKGQRIIIEFNESKQSSKQKTPIKETDVVKVEKMKSLEFASTSLHQYVFEEDSDYKVLKELCDNKNLWEKNNINIKDNDINSFIPRQDSLFDICRIQNNENCFSNALKYFMDTYPTLWRKFFKDEKNIDLGENFSVEREEPTESIKKEGNNANLQKIKKGRIDLLVRSDKLYVIIENKIKSDIIKDYEENGVEQTQLNRYWDYVCQKLIPEECKNNVDVNVKGFVLAPNYYNPDNLKIKEYEMLFYSEICDFLYKDGKFKEEVESDADFKAFYNAMKRHSYDTENESLYEDMKNTFFTRIKELREKNNGKEQTN